jgi:deoxyribonuclease V
MQEEASKKMEKEMAAWDGTAKGAIALQKKMRELVRTGSFSGEIRVIAGADVSLERFGTELYAGIVLMSYPDLAPLGHAVAKIDVKFPYIPGLLSFREIPGLLECIRKLPIRPDLIVVDGQGIAHPRRLGIASHLGVATGISTIGCAKSRLFGVYNEPKKTGSAERIIDPETGEHLGYALNSKERSNPLIISPGFGISPEESLEIVKSCLRGYRLPEPTRRAHELVNEFRKGNIKS